MWIFLGYLYSAIRFSPLTSPHPHPHPKVKAEIERDNQTSELLQILKMNMPTLPFCFSVL